MVGRLKFGWASLNVMFVGFVRFARLCRICHFSGRLIESERGYLRGGPWHDALGEASPYLRLCMCEVLAIFDRAAVAQMLVLKTTRARGGVKV